MGNSNEKEDIQNMEILCEEASNYILTTQNCNIKYNNEHYIEEIPMFEFSPTKEDCELNLKLIERRHTI